MAAELRPIIRALLAQLASGGGDGAHDAVTDAYLALEQSQRLDATQRRWATEPAPATARPRTADDIVQEYRALLPREFLGLRLTEAEKSSLERAIVDLLVSSDDPSTVAGAARALGPSARIDLVPGLSSLVRRFAPSNVDIATNAINSIRKILEFLDGDAPLSENEFAIIREAFSALRYAADKGTSDRTMSSRDAAVTELEMLTIHFGRSFPDEGGS